MLPFILVGLAGLAIVALCKEPPVIAKKYLVLGMRGTGKTQLNTFLSTGNIPTESVQTVLVSTTKRRETTINGNNVVFDESFDVPGDTSSYEKWKDLMQKSNIIIYLIKLDDYFRSPSDIDYFRRLKRDIGLISGYVKNEGHIKKDCVFIVGTHSDRVRCKSTSSLIDLFRKKMPQETQEYIDHIKNNKINVEYCISRLDTTNGAQRLMEDVYNSVDSNLRISNH